MGRGVIRTYTFAQAMDEVRRMAAHLHSLNLPRASRVAIFSKNTAWWFLADLAIWMAGHVSVPIYPTLAAKTIRAIIDHSESKLIFVGKLDNFQSMEPGLPKEMTRIAMPLGPALTAPKWEEIVQRQDPLTESPRRGFDELATIVYTSGSTGEPKGVMHSFRTMSAAAAFEEYFKFTPQDRVISYLPLAHVAERSLLETTTFKIGHQVFFSESLDTFIEDVKRAQPTVFGTVPRLWLKFQSGVHAKMPPEKLQRLLKIPLVGGIVRKKVLEGLGLAKVRFAATGSAPTPPDVSDWYAALGLKLHDIYGMTENWGVSHATRYGDVRAGYVGVPMQGVTCKLSEEGEVLVKSPGNMLGYYKAEHLTRELIDSEGFLHTGDRGEIDAQGRLKLTGRVKELFKTSKGKYVAPAPIENRLLASPELEQACVSGANMAQPYALAVLAEHLRKSPSLEGQRERITRVLEHSIARINSELDPHEQLAKLVVVSDEWTVENGLLTPTLKLKRAAIEARYASHIGNWYQRGGTVLWA
jgi:long-subunit acyl-CoA synthetase (AMP-forming)